MKRVKTAISILIIIPLIIFASHFYLKHSTSKMADTLAGAETLIKQGKMNEAARQVAAFDHNWNSNKAIYATFIRHSELDTVNIGAAKLMPYIENDDVGEFCAESEGLRVQLTHIWQTERFSIDNVL